MLPEFENHRPQEQVCVYERQIAGEMEFAGNGEVSRKNMYESESQIKQAWDDDKNLAPKSTRARSYLTKPVLVSAPWWRAAQERLVTEYRIGQTPWDNLASRLTDFSPVCDRDVFLAVPRNQKKWAVPHSPQP